MTVPISNITASWTSSSNTYTGIGMNVTSTAYSSESKLINLKRDGVSKFNVDASGNLITSGIINCSKINLAGVDLATSIGISYGGTNSVYGFANSAFEQANTARNQANDAYTQANTLNITQTRLATSFNTYGNAPFYPIRAWVTFSAADPPIITSNGNVQNVTRTSIGTYIVTFITQLPTSYYAPLGSCLDSNDNIVGFKSLTTSNCIITVFDNAGGKQDQGNVSAIFVC